MQVGTIDEANKMDKLAKRYGVQNSGQQGSSGNGNTGRIQLGGANGGASPVRPVPVQNQASNPGSSLRPSNTASRGNNNTRPRGANQRQNQAKNNGGGGSGGKNLPALKGGNQPQGLGSFDELGLTGAEQGSRKHNFSHLLNFSYGHGQRYMGGNYGRYGGGYHQRMYQHYKFQPRYNKEQFLQATCQFVVKDSEDYSVYQVDPDVLVDWANIEQINVKGVEEINCPICLHRPFAAKMTRCGHIYCWPCLLHYLALSDANYRTCPICYESIYAADLKSVTSQVLKPVGVGEEITMKLMVCAKNSSRPYPAEDWSAVTVDEGLYNVEDNSRGETKWIHDDEAKPLSYSKMLLIRPDQTGRAILDREQAELTFALETDPDSPESCFIQSALSKLANRREKTTTVDTPTLPKSHSMPSIKTAAPVPKKPSLHRSKTYWDPYSDEEHAHLEEEDFRVVDETGGIVGIDEDGVYGSVEDASVASGSSKGESSQAGKGSESSPTGNLHWFYQSADGQHVYLHPLNIRMLAGQYGHVSKAPREIVGKVVDLDMWSITEETRKRFRYLSHLPLTCQFNVVELEMMPPVVSEETLHAFQKDIDQRQHVRQMKLRDEVHRQEQAENAFRKDIRGRVSFSLQSELFPAFAPEPAEELPDFASQEAFPSVGTEPAPSTSPSSPPATTSATSSAPRSFAQMLREGKIQRQTASSRKPASDAPPPTQPSGRGDADSDEGPDTVTPNFQATFSASLDAAFDRLVDAAGGAPQAAGKGSKKKKTKTKMTLLSSGALPRV